jgi:CheY-like chemotaxis protein
MAKKILIIEDDEFLGEVLDKRLTAAGYETELVATGRRGLEQIKALKPDLVLLDIILPEMDGYEILEAKLEDPEIKDIPVIVVSNSGQQVELNRALELGVKDYLVKAQFDPNEVLTKVRAELGDDEHLCRAGGKPLKRISYARTAKRLRAVSLVGDDRDAPVATGSFCLYHRALIGESQTRCCLLEGAHSHVPDCFPHNYPRPLLRLHCDCIANARLVYDNGRPLHHVTTCEWLVTSPWGSPGLRMSIATSSRMKRMAHNTDHNGIDASAFEPITINRMDAEFLIDALGEYGTEQMLAEAREIIANAVDGQPNPTPTEFVLVPIEDFRQAHEALRRQVSPFTHEDVPDLILGLERAWRTFNHVGRVTRRVTRPDAGPPSAGVPIL